MKSLLSVISIYIEKHTQYYYTAKCLDGKHSRCGMNHNDCGKCTCKACGRKYCLKFDRAKHKQLTCCANCNRVHTCEMRCDKINIKKTVGPRGILT
jgi:hypothetical protein